ncbi:hypothetical protein AVEN_103438-1 [Araneus ventricosus]|uniref:Uncharacterized protein n=1 Tax=Araneus ventricosus TaxID=182803 RepID=A0A4Y2H365_ARAVE|nr:hypothetical protein AVEN_103438-1 [Araneus ventricosus]
MGVSPKVSCITLTGERKPAGGSLNSLIVHYVGGKPREWSPKPSLTVQRKKPWEVVSKLQLLPDTCRENQGRDSQSSAYP